MEGARIRAASSGGCDLREALNIDSVLEMALRFGEHLEGEKMTMPPIGTPSTRTGAAAISRSIPGGEQEVYENDVVVAPSQPRGCQAVLLVAILRATAVSLTPDRA